jgi:CrcB protein
VQNIIAIAMGGAIGALFRYWVSTGVYNLLGRDFPYGTLAVNVIGSFVMGVMYVYLIERLSDTSMLRAMIIIGLLGAFTTFSTFSIETLQLFENGEVIKTMLNILLSVVVCLIAVWSGVVLARYLAS